MAKIIDGKLLDSGRAKITLDGSGTGTLTVSFSESFVAKPAVAAYCENEDLSVVTATLVTATQFLLSVTAAGVTSRDVYVYWAAVGA